MKRKPKLEIYKARDGYRWRLRSPNNRILADSGEAFVSERNARRGFDAAMDAAYDWSGEQ